MLGPIFRLSFASETSFRQQEETSTPLTPAGLFAAAEIPWQDLAFSSTLTPCRTISAHVQHTGPAPRERPCAAGRRGRNRVHPRLKPLHSTAQGD